MVLHLHGELLKARSTLDDRDIVEWKTDLVLGDHCSKGYQMRPHIVWFGEDVPMMEQAIDLCQTADMLLIVGTSMQVYPAASLMHYVPKNTMVYYIDPRPALASQHNLEVIAEPATTGVKKVISRIRSHEN